MLQLACAHCAASKSPVFYPEVFLQLVKAVSGAVVGLRGQLEALTILDETALTWPGLSLVRHVLQSMLSLPALSHTGLPL